MAAQLPATAQSPVPLPPNDPPAPIPPVVPDPIGPELPEAPIEEPPEEDAPLPGQVPPPVGDPPSEAPTRMREIGGPAGPEPTRYGDWERKGRVSDF